MTFRNYAAFAVSAAVLLSSFPAFAVEQLPLPDPQMNRAAADVREFVQVADRGTPSSHCEAYLKQNTTNDRINAIKAYRACRADQALSKLAVWRWQEASN